jgi:hypothetical protein
MKRPRNKGFIRNHGKYSPPSHGRGMPEGQGRPVKNDEKPANLIPVLRGSTKSLATTYSKE